MALLGASALAMWWDIASEIREDFEDWHAHEHFPERMSIPGFRRGTRYANAAGGDGMFVIYEIDDHAVLSSPAYVSRLNAPTPWSTRLMPHHRHMVRSQCRVLASRGGSIAGHALTLRLTPVPGADERLQRYLRELVMELPGRPGLTAAHLLRHQDPHVAMTTEQKIRDQADRVADCVFLVCGYRLETLELLRTAELSDELLREHGAAEGMSGATYAMACSATSVDVA